MRQGRARRHAYHDASRHSMACERLQGPRSVLLATASLEATARGCTLAGWTDGAPSPRVVHTLQRLVGLLR